MADVKLPSAFLALGCGKKVPVDGESVREVLFGLDADCPGSLDRLMDDKGAVKRYVNVYRNDDDIRDLEGIDTPVSEDDVIWIIPAVAGGSGEPRER
ncbi:MoaD/ThiS family protein [Streptomyces sp. NPDC089919]|uniref:MoaD/ThiS family protein n=1 Tax=Streptomyces sp. NPDC089919 TaxID=3155188 RepID=UPI0034275A1F